MRWAEMTVVCAAEASDAVSYAFVEAGCPGVMLVGKDPVTVQGSLPVTDEYMARITDLRAHLNRLPEFGLPALVDGITLRYAEEEDWANAWKQYFKPIRLGKRLVVKPGWEEYAPEPNDLVLELDPGMAFGTGGHPTTKLCMQALEDYVQFGMRVADIGTGSGILAIAAAKLGANPVLATDIDELARRVARENVARNGMEATVSVLDMEPFDAQAINCDLVVANIVARTIIELAPSLPFRLRPTGVFIASGIVEDFEAQVTEALTNAGFTILEIRREDIWLCFVSRHNTLPTDAQAHSDQTIAPPPIPHVDHDWAS